MLPRILDVAGEYGLTFDPKTYGKKQTLAKCPFCKEDSLPHKKKKYYLSLNTEEQLYKCWFCKESGGVLHLEAKLSGKSFSEIRSKYFGNRRKKDLHPAYLLNPEQLEIIGWREQKRKDFQGFLKKRETIYRDWKRYVHEQFKVYYALYLCIVWFDFDKKVQQKNMEWFIKKCWENDIPNFFDAIQDEWLNQKRKSWAKQGEILAHVAWNSCIESGDFEYKNLFTNVLFANFLIKETNKKYLPARVEDRNELSTTQPVEKIGG